MTNWPGLTDLTALPTSSTNPQYSWPIGWGPLVGCNPRYGHRSDPHTHVAAMRMTASVGFSILGVSRSSKRMSRGPYSTVPLIGLSPRSHGVAGLLVELLGPAQNVGLVDLRLPVLGADFLERHGDGLVAVVEHLRDGLSDPFSQLLLLRLRLSRP